MLRNLLDEVILSYEMSPDVLPHPACVPLLKRTLFGPGQSEPGHDPRPVIDKHRASEAHTPANQGQRPWRWWCSEWGLATCSGLPHDLSLHRCPTCAMDRSKTVPGAGKRNRWRSFFPSEAERYKFCASGLATTRRVLVTTGRVSTHHVLGLLALRTFHVHGNTCVVFPADKGRQPDSDNLVRRGLIAAFKAATPRLAPCQAKLFVKRGTIECVRDITKGMQR